jgi:hypothetical protein
MGLSNTSQGNNEKMLTQIGDKLALRVPQGTAGATERILTGGSHKGEPVYEMYYSNLTGKFIGGKLNKVSYGLRAGVYFDDGEDTYLLEFGAKDKQFKSLVERIPNLNMDEQFTISLSASKTKRTSGGNAVVNLFVNQNGTNVDSAYIEWNKNEAGKSIPTYHNGCPAPTESRGEMSYDLQDNFMIDKFEEYFTAHPMQTPVHTAGASTPQPTKGTTQSTAHSDDLKAIRSALKASPEIGKALTMMDGEDGEAQAFALNHWDEAKGDHDEFILAMKVGLKLVEAPAADKTAEPDGSTNAPDSEEPPIGEAPDDVDLGGDEDTGGLPF